MAETPSTMMLGRGTRAPDFSLPDGEGEVFELEDVLGEHGLALAFVCNHCPFVIHLADAIGDMAREFMPKGMGFVAINSNDIENYPQDAPEHMVGFAAEHGWDFPYLFDATQDVARAYRAACTPDFYVFDRGLRLIYCGQFDESRPGNSEPVTGRDLRAALNAALGDGQPPEPQLPSSGCNIKWKP